MKLSKFNFKLPENLIAQYPPMNRDESRLMVVHKDSGKIEHKVFKDIINYFDEGDRFVFNNTKVFPARLFGNKEKTGAKIEVFLLRELNEEHKLWDVLVSPARKIRIGNKLYFGDDHSLVAEVMDNTTSRGRTLRFLYDGDHEEFKRILFSHGETPLPKFIQRDVTEDDAERYQTIFAKHEGAVAAPTAGLHFSRELLKRFEIKGIETSEVTLHMGLGNFRTVDVEDLTKHKIDSEQMAISDPAVSEINDTISKKKKIISVGATVTKVLESSVTTTGFVTEYQGWTNKFIFPPYDFKIADAMVSNFHLPYSTLLMSTAAFGGYDLIMDVYETAVKEEYRFGSYGDALVIV